MANHPSAEKRNRQRITRTSRNRTVRSAVRTHMKAVREAVKAGEKDGAKKALQIAISEIDKACSKGILHAKSASRSIARLSAAVHKLG